ncbi:MAG: hypothetical protein QM676_11255 [Novosphingobium sp.]
MLATMLAFLAAQALPEAPPPGPVEPPRSGVQQVFIAPSGEAFRAPADAPYPVAAWFTRADADHDGKLTEAEFDADFLAYFASLDLNHDGTVDGGELEAYETAMASELHTGNFTGYSAYSTTSGDEQDVTGPDSDIRISTKRSSGLDTPRGAGRFDFLRIPEPVAAMDTGLNGRISREEALDAATYRFSLLDPKHRGYLVLAELPETFAQRSRIDGERRGKRHKTR